MARTFVLFDDDDHARLARIMAKYSSRQIQAIQLDQVLLDNSPALQVRLPPRRKSALKIKAPDPVTRSPRRKPGRKTQVHDGPHKA